MMDTTTHVSGETGLPEKPYVRRTRHIGLVDATSVALYIDGGDSPLIVKVDPQAILGRSAPNSPVQPQVDLTPASAFEKGVSRLHAVIRRMEDSGELVLQDMGSSNGTMIRGARLSPGVPHPLTSGDRFRLGQLEIEIYFGDNGESTGDTPIAVEQADADVAPPVAFTAPPTVVSPTRQLAKAVPTDFEGALPIHPDHVFSEMGLITEDIIRYLSSLEGCEVTLTLEIKAHKPGGFDETETNIVTDRSRILRFSRSEFKSE